MNDAPATPRSLLLPAAALAVMLAYAPALAAPFVAAKLVVLVLAGALGAGLWLLARAEGAPSGRLDPGIARAGLAVLLTTALSALLAARRSSGAPYAGAELVRWSAAAGVALGAAALEPRERGRLGDAIQVAATLVSFVGLTQHFGVCPLRIPSISVPGSTFGNRNIAAEAIAMALPFGLARLRDDAPGAVRGSTAGAFAIVQAAFLAVARTRGAWLGGAAGLAVFLAVRRPRWSGRALAVVAATAAASALAAWVPGHWTRHDAGDAKRFAPATQVVRDGMSPSSPVARTRLGLWRRAWSMVHEAPLTGIGPGNFAVRFPLYAEPGAEADGVLGPTLAPRRVHDDLLERLVETGVLGLAALAALYAALAAAAIRRARGSEDQRSEAAGYAGAVAAIAGCGATGFPLAMPATVFLFAVAAGGLAALPDAGESAARATPARRAAALAAGMGLLVAAGLWSARQLACSYFLGRAERMLTAGELAGDLGGGGRRALAELARAERAKPGDFDVALRTAFAAAVTVQPALATAAAERALAVEPESPNAWEALARARFESGDMAGAEAAANHALERLHDYPAAFDTRARAARARQSGGR